MHDAEHWRMVVDERDVDRELAIATHELLGAVERVDQPVGIPAAAFDIRHGCRFLGHDRILRLQGAQSGDDFGIGRQICRGER